MKLLDRLNQIKPVKETSIELYQLIMKEGTITGSTAWGVNTIESDIDVILPPEFLP